MTLIMKRTLPAGYTMKVCDEHWQPCPPGYSYSTQAFYITVHDADGAEVGLAEVYHHGADAELMVSNVEVAEPHRRKGLATAMYCLAEELSGKTMKPYPEQYDDGQVFWAQENRPFGRGKP